MGEESATSHFKFAAELERIFASPEFTRSPVMRRLLRFLVDQTLAGRGDQLKAYSVAVDGLGRDPDFDAQTDSYPRVQVGRLRRMLDAYYARSGTGTGERLVIPNGAYRVFLLPVYRKQERSAPWPLDTYVRKEEAGPTAALEEGFSAFPLASTAARRPGANSAGPVGIALIAVLIALTVIVLVVAARHASSGPKGLPVPTPTLLLLPAQQGPNSPASLASSVDQVLGDALHRSWVVNVQSPGGRPRNTVYRLQAVLAGPAGEDLYLTLWDNQSGQRIWTHHSPLSGQEGRLEEQLRAPISNMIGTFGVIATDQRKQLGGTVEPGYPCLLKSAEFRFRLGKANLATASDCLQQMLATKPENAEALAAAADLNFRLASLEPGRARALKALARDQAKRALLLDPYSAQSQIVSATAAFVDGNCQSGKAQGLRALELNPYEAEYRARLGMALFQCGDSNHEAYLTAARQLFPGLPAIFSLPVISAMADRGEGREALDLALSLPPAPSSNSPFYPLTMAVAYAAAGETGQARSYWQQVNAAAGDGKTPRQLLHSIFISDGLADAIGRVLLRTGVVNTL